MENKKLNLRFGIICAMILVAAGSRFIPHPPNFSPVGSIALLGAAYYGRRYWAYLIPLAAMFLSDVALNNVVYRAFFGGGFTWLYSGALFTYGAMLLIVLMGAFTLKKISIPRLVASALGASVVFYLVSNFGVWVSTGMYGLYPRTFAGLMECYVAGLPFLQNVVAGDLVYTIVLFGAFELMQRRIPALRLQRA
ncbi:MAG: hypothetical protein LBJ23_01660 [Tannerella sp.]|jgi:hypothetical protein|nr:hypothetical protein [Tannerella sp.]